MAKNILFDNGNWGDDFSEIPRLDDFIKNEGKKYNSAAGSLSRYNQQRTGKRATLHLPTAKAVERVGKYLAMEAEGKLQSVPFAYGVQKDASGEITHLMSEFETDIGTIAAVYIPKTGQFKASVFDSFGNMKNLPTIKNGGYDGEILLFLLCMYSYSREPEFTENIKRYYVAPDPNNRWDIQNMFKLNDNIYRRLNTLTSSQIATNPEAVLPCSIPESGNVPAITQLKLDNGEYTPTEAVCGTFKYLVGGKKKSIRKPSYKTLDDMKKNFFMGNNVSDFEKGKIAKVDTEKIKPSKYLLEMARMAKAGMRVFMLRGEAGTGKTTDAMALSYVTGLPYRRFTCSENTDESNLIVNMIPNTKKDDVKINLPTLQDILMDPATALSKVSGEYKDGIEEEEAFSEILKKILKIQNKKNEKDFIMVESEIIKGCELPSIVEIQEPACISKQATLVALNSLFDGGKTITLLDGTEIERNPDSIFIFTTNSNYRGCREFNESVLSRMEEIIDYDIPTIGEMVDRVIKKTGIDESERPNLELMAQVVRDIQEYCRENMINGGVCCTREYENWVRAYMVKGDMKEAAKYAVISKVSSDQEERDEIVKAVIDTKL